MRDRILQHRNLVNEYLKEVESGVNRLRELYRGQPNAKNIESTRNKVANSLSSMAAKVDEATGNPEYEENGDWSKGMDRFNKKFTPLQIRSLTDPSKFPQSYFLGLLEVIGE